MPAGGVKRHRARAVPSSGTSLAATRGVPGGPLAAQVRSCWVEAYTFPSAHLCCSLCPCSRLGPGGAPPEDAHTDPTVGRSAEQRVLLAAFAELLGGQGA